MSSYTPNEYLMMGYVAMSFGPDNAVKLFNKYAGSRDFRSPPSGIARLRDGSYRLRDVVLDYHVDTKGTVVQQGMWQPSQTGDVHRHFRDASILLPVFFIRPDYVIGVDISHVAANRPGSLLNIFNADAPAPMGNLATTHFCLKWPGYAQEYRKQVELRDSTRAPINMSKLVERITSFVARFIEEASHWPIDQNNAHWRVGRGAITKEHLYIVGIVHVSAGCWQPIIQLKAMNWRI